MLCLRRKVVDNMTDSQVEALEHAREAQLLEETDDVFVGIARAPSCGCLLGADDMLELPRHGGQIRNALAASNVQRSQEKRVRGTLAIDRIAAEFHAERAVARGAVHRKEDVL